MNIAFRNLPNALPATSTQTIEHTTYFVLNQRRLVHAQQPVVIAVCVVTTFVLMLLGLRFNDTNYQIIMARHAEYACYVRNHLRSGCSHSPSEF